MPTRFERWMRSKLSTSTALTPSNLVPLAAQSRLDPVPYSLPPMIDERRALGLVGHRGVEDRHLGALGQLQRDAALGARRHQVADADVGERAAHHDLVVAAARAVAVEVGLGRRRRRSGTSRPGTVARMLPAGEMWSVVTESPSLASTRAPEKSATTPGSIVRPSKYGGSFT